MIRHLMVTPCLTENPLALVTLSRAVLPSTTRVSTSGRRGMSLFLDLFLGFLVATKKRKKKNILLSLCGLVVYKVLTIPRLCKCDW